MIFIDKPAPIGKWCNECNSKEDVLAISVEGAGKRSSIPLCRSCRAALALLLQPDALAELRKKVQAMESAARVSPGFNACKRAVLAAIDGLAKTEKGEADA